MYNFGNNAENFEKWLLELLIRIYSQKGNDRIWKKKF